MTGRRGFIKQSALASAALGLVSPIKAENGKKSIRGSKGRRPNIVFIMTDQQRYDSLGFLGQGPLRTPNLDQLAASGCHFSRAYCPSPACGPSRASLFTGVYPATSGHRRNPDAHHADLPLFTNRLRAGGYQTALVGKRHLHPIEGDHGFAEMKLCDAHYDTYDADEGRLNAYFDYLAGLPGSPARDEIVAAGGKTEALGWKDPLFWLGKDWQGDPQHLTNWTAREACDFIDRQSGDDPYFLNVSFFGPHHPYRSAWPWTDLYDPSEMDLPDTLMREKKDPIFRELKGKMRAALRSWEPEYWQKFIAQYYGYMSQIDRAVGEIFNALKEKGEWENTWIVFASDHGDHLGNWGLLGKTDPYETSARIPLIIKPAGEEQIPPGGRKITANVNWLALHGTLLDIAGLPGWREDRRLETRSLLPLIEGDPSGWIDETALFWGRERDRYSMGFWRGDLKVVRLRRPDEDLIEIYNVAVDPLEEYNLYPEMRDTSEGRSLVAAARAWGDEQEARFR